MVSKNVGADPLSGVCKMEYGTLWMIWVESFLHFSGFFLFLAGLGSMIRIGIELGEERNLELLMPRVGKFTAVYLLPKCK